MLVASESGRHPLRATASTSVRLHPYETIAYPNGRYAHGFTTNDIARTHDINTPATSVPADVNRQHLEHLPSERSNVVSWSASRLR